MKALPLVIPKQVDIADPHIVEPCLFCCLKALIGEMPRGCGQVTHEELGVEGEKAVRDLWIKGGDKHRNVSHFLLIDIPWDKKGAGDEEGG